MSAKSSLFLKSTVVVAMIVIATWTTIPAIAQDNGKLIQGIPQDWTHRHLIFSTPTDKSLAELMELNNNPRFVLQQLQRSRLSAHVPATISAQEDLSANGVVHRTVPPHRDWAFSLGGGSVAQNMYPAKYSFNINDTPNCITDYVAYGLNVAGSSSQANLVALNELYSGTGGGFCGRTVPSVYWAYNVTTKTGGKVTTSPVLSFDGNEVIFVESSTSGGSVLHILRWNASDGGTVSAPKTPTQSQTSFGACTGSSSCLVNIALGTAAANITTYSSPFYDYADDVVYVGDDTGVLYRVTPVLGAGTPVVTKLTVSSGNALSGPVYDSTSGNIFVGAGTSLWAVKASTFTLQTHPSLQVGDSSCNTANNILFDSPIVDSSDGWVYEWATTGTDDTHTVVVQAHTSGTNSPSGSSWSAAATANVGEGDTTCNSTAKFPTWTPNFDNTYYNGTLTSGHLWVCGRSNSSSAPELWEIPTSGTGGLFGTPSASGVINATLHAECSPMTEIFNTTSSTDYLFFGEGLAGSFGSLYGFTLGSGTVTAIMGSPITYPSATGGTSAIVMDNVSSVSQASSIYFTTLATSTTVCGSTSAYCAVKLTQAGLQ